jgi:hypothetical protein
MKGFKGRSKREGSPITRSPKGISSDGGKKPDVEKGKGQMGDTSRSTEHASWPCGSEAALEARLAKARTTREGVVALNPQ